MKDSELWEQKQYKQMIADLKKIDTIYVIGARMSNNEHWDKGIWRYFNLYYVKDNKMNRIWINPDLKEYQKPSAWDQESHTFTDNVLGSNRSFEVVYSLYHKVYPRSRNVLNKMPKIEFLSYFDGNDEEYDEKEIEEDADN